MTENTARVLIVDDEEKILNILSRLVEREGFKALVAPDGDTALKKIGMEMPRYSTRSKEAYRQ